MGPIILPFIQNQTTSSPEELTALTSVLGVVVALVVALGTMIWQTNLENKRQKIELFNLRYELYNELQSLLSAFAPENNPNFDDIINSLYEKAYFLFSSKVEKAIRAAGSAKMDVDVTGQNLKRLREARSPDSPQYKPNLPAEHETWEYKQHMQAMSDWGNASIELAKWMAHDLCLTDNKPDRLYYQPKNPYHDK